jgi:hypothetical protein
MYKVVNSLLYLSAVSIMIIMGVNFAYDQPILGNPLVKALYAIVCFFLWIKLYYFMGIFRKFAYFVTIIQEIIKELYVFIVMLLILMLAFTNFFYVIDDKENYIERYWQASDDESNTIINSFL